MRQNEYDVYLFSLNEPSISQIIQPKCNCKLVSIYTHSDMQRNQFTATIERKTVQYALTINFI